MIKKIYLAGGCYWGVQELLRKLDGVKATRVGFSGGDPLAKKYEDVCTGLTGHAETVEVTYNSEEINLFEIFDYFFLIHDPTTIDQQGNDRGTQYRSVIFVESKDDEVAAHEAIERAKENWSRHIVTQVAEFKEFFLAKEEHQDYLQKNPNGYTCHYIRKKP